MSEPTLIVKHYSSDERPIVKGLGLDGITVGESREDAEEFVKAINARIASLERQLEDAKAQLAERTRERDDGIKLLADFHDSLCGNRHNESLEQVVERVGNYLDPHILLIRERRWADNANLAKEKARAESAERALEEAGKDGERYRWLRDTEDATWRPFGIREGYSAAQADAAIDSAIEAEKQNANPA